MRIRTAVIVLGTAAALSALAVPSANADEAQGDTAITKVVVNGGKPIVVGTSDKKISYTISGSDSSGLAYGGAFLWRGTSLDAPSGVTGFGETETCSATACTVTATVSPKLDELPSSQAGTWNVLAELDGTDGDIRELDKGTTIKVLRGSHLTVNATPEPVKKGKAITVTGTLTRANWDTLKYGGYASQSVQLQFRKKGSTTYTTVKTVKSGSTGALKTTVKASVDGYWRYAFGTNATTGGTAATADYVDVR
ncbi:calcium-binding protein [Streptomyces sp. NPDC006207]